MNTLKYAKCPSEEQVGRVSLSSEKYATLNDLTPWGVGWGGTRAVVNVAGLGLSPKW